MAARRAIGAAALILMAANLTGSVLGFVRGAVIARVFGANLRTDAFYAASIVPQMFYDLTVGAAISAALIPTFTDIWERRGAPGLNQTVGSVLALAWITLAVLVAALIALAHPLMTGLLVAYPHRHQAQVLSNAVPMVRILVCSLFFLGTSAVLLSTLYSVRRFTVSAFAPSLYHTGIIAGAVFAARPLGVFALPVGACAGAAAQAAVQVPAAIRQLGRVRPRLHLDAEVRRIVRLYAPVAAGLLISIAGQVVDLILKAKQGEATIVWMQIATTLVQFPVGIAAAAMSFAVLPSISADASFARMDQFKHTLTLGMRLVLFLTIPAAVGYLTLATPIVGLLFEHGHFRAHDTAQTVTALLGYAIQIPFVGVDQLLIFAFYARNNTVTPMLVGVVGVLGYVVSALLLMPRWHILGLALANTIQNSGHMVILFGLLLLAVGSLRGTGLTTGLARIAIAAGIMTGSVLVSLHLLESRLTGRGLNVWGPEVFLPIAVGLVFYVAASALLGSQELTYLWDLIRRGRETAGARGGRRPDAPTPDL